MLDELKKAYDYILSNSAPVMAVVDASVLAEHADGVLFSVMCGVSQLTSLEESYLEIRQLGVPILGAVVSGPKGSVTLLQVTWQSNFRVSIVLHKGVDEFSGHSLARKRQPTALIGGRVKRFRSSR